MRVLFLHLPRFPIQRRVAEMPSLAGKPIALSQETRGHRQVAFASTSALTAGVRPGMTIAAATALVPSLREFSFQLDDERKALGSLGEGLLAIAPAFQLAAPDGLWLDASAAPLSQGEEGLCRRSLEIGASFGYRGKAIVASQLFTARALAREGAA
jgi:protein ImuB